MFRVGLAEPRVATQGGRAMAFSTRARQFMKFWIVLSGLMFFAQCAMRAEPYLKVILKKPASAQTK